MSEEDIMLDDSPSVSKEVEMFVYDLITMERVRKNYLVLNYLL